MMGHRWLSGLIYVFLSIVLLLAVKKENRLEVDSQLYERIALQFKDHHRLNDPNSPNIMPTISVGYPLFLGIVYKLFGHNFFYVILIQILLGLAIIQLIYKTANLLFNESAACLSAFLASINPAFVTYTQYLLTEILLVTLLLSFFYLFLKFLNNKNNYDLFYSSLCFAMSWIVKPVGIFFIIASLLTLFAQKVDLKKYIIFLLPLFSIGSIYIYHNYKMYTEPIFTLAGHENIFRYYLPRVMAAEKNIDLAQAEQIVDSQISSDAGFKRYANLYGIFFNYIFKHPVLCLKIWFFNVFKTCLGLHFTAFKVLLNNSIKGGSCAFFNMGGNYFEKIKNYVSYGTNNNIFLLLAFYEIFFLILQYLGLLFSLYFLLLQKNFTYAFLIVAYVSYFALITGHDGFGRYRTLFEPILVACTGHLLSLIIKFLQKRSISEHATA